MSKSITTASRASQWCLRLLLLAVVGCVLLNAGSGSASAASAPLFSVTQDAAPTNFAPGSTAPETEAVAAASPQYVLTVANLGGSAATGEVTIVDTLPAGVTQATVDPPTERTGEGAREACAVSGQTVTCTVSEPVQPGQFVVVNIPVDVDPSAPASVVNHVTVSGGGAAPVGNSISTTVSGASATFGFLPGAQGLSVTATSADGTTATQAGSHPFFLSIGTAFPTQKLPGAPTGNDIVGAGTLRDLLFSLPKGVVVNPSATAIRCTDAQLASTESGGGCPPATEIGQVILLTNLLNLQSVTLPLYNMVPLPGEPAEFGFVLAGTYVHVHGGLNGDFTLSAAVSEILALVGSFDVQTVLWGDPSSPALNHDRTGVGCGFKEPCPTEPTTVPFLTLPSACSGPLSTTVRADSWEEPGNLRTRTAPTTDTNGNPVGIEGCTKLVFNPAMTVQPDSHAADSPTGLSVDLKVPQGDGIESLATATLKKTVVQLPAGMAINPSAADGLVGCAPADIGIGMNRPPTCPDASKIGEAELTTPLLGKTIDGAVYLAEQHNNPFGSLLADYIVLEGEGIVIKLPGKVELDPVTGQITNTFDDNPALPFSDLKVHFDAGPRAALATPVTCGSYQTSLAVSPWSAAVPDNPTPAETKMFSDAFSIATGPGGSPCSNPGFAPGFSAGVTNPVAGSSSSFVLQLTRHDGEQNVSSLTTVLPPGLLAKLAGVSLCPEAQAASGECPAASQVGETTVAVGSGATPLYVPQPGKAPTAVYLAGPYKGAPYSLVIKVPAETDSLNLGVVVVRAAIHVDPNDAHVTVISDPLPQILQGIPLRYREIRVTIDRPGFMLSPTSCEPMAITGTATSSAGVAAPLSSRVQVGGCEGLAFKPSFSATTEGKGNFHGASLDVKITQKPGEAAIRKVDT
jgi:Domain of unknown function DUF11